MYVVEQATEHATGDAAEVLGGLLDELYERATLMVEVVAPKMALDSAPSERD